ncbi:peptidase domain-containing ABC transporter [Sneathiella chinensis]|uniref:Uncharacterized protein n=1 Tax=Sneathiella chinensis TaxID=349750 RepID=A0ABQ5U4X3_9PROT|nr:peptidase domain-containing ABC transporter [Sneathiella chinensis]GLQ07189.1 hypothetical protein GCM10007924_24100 [Sneathiella chinensis]
MGQGKPWFAAIRRKLRPLLWEMAVYSFFVNILALVIPLFVLQVYNRVVAFGAITTLQGLVLGVVLVLVFDFLLRQIRSRLLQKAAMRLDIGIGEALVRKIWSLPLRVLESRPSSYWQGLFRDADMVRNTVAGPPFLLLIDLPFSLLFVGLIFVIAEPVAWVFAGVIPVFILLGAISARSVSRVSNDEKDAQRRRDSLIGDMIDNRGTVKALSLDRGLQPQWEKVHADGVERALHRGMNVDFFANTGMILTLATTVLITSFGALAIIDQKLSIGALIAANMLSSRVIGPFSQLVGGWKGFAMYRQARQRLDDVMTLPEERQETTIDLDKPAGEILLENVCFRYRADGDPVLEGLGVRFAPRAVHVIMGPNGGGKTTLIKLLTGLYSPESGRVLLDGADLGQFTRRQLAGWIGYVPQNSVLVDGTIRDNITGKRPDISDREVVEICKAVGLHRIISDYPDGYGTPVGEAGGALSGGIRQRIAIARALIGHPPVLILDEPSASLDRPAENMLRDLLKNLSQDHTIIVVSHSPTLLNMADYLYLLDRRRMVISGPREEVLNHINSLQAGAAAADGTRNRRANV